MRGTRPTGVHPFALSLRAAAVSAISCAVLALVGCASTPKKSGGFYQDDGPPRDVPRDLARTPDAVPRIEPFHPYANRPYTALGRNYTPITDDRPFRQRGMASWYGRQFHGNRTASGERYDMLAMTAAHPILPIPSYVRVTNVKNGASVIVRVNDRGPFKPDRVIDLSYAAATRLGIAASGTGEVEVVRLTNADIRAGRLGSAAAEAERDPPQPPVSPRAPLPAPAMTVASGAVQLPASAGRASTAAAPWSVQLGAFEAAANAQALRDRIGLLLGQSDGFSVEERSPRVEYDGGLHRVLIGQLATRGEAQALAARLERALDRPTALHVAR